MSKPFSNHPHKKLLRILLIIAGAALGIAAVGAIVYALNPGWFRTQQYDSAAADKAREIISSQSQKTTIRTIESGLGFRIPYDTQTFDAFGQVVRPVSDGTVSREEFSGDALATKRNYTIVTLRQKNNDSLPGAKYRTPTDLTVSTNYRKNYFDRSKLNEKYRSLSDLDVLLESEKIKIKDSGSTVTEQQKIKVNNQDFYKLVVKRDVQLFNTSVARWTYRYITVNDGSPYWFVIGPDLDEQATRDVGIYESLIRDTTFSKHDDGSIVRSGEIRLASTSGSTSDQSDSISDPATLKVVARNQISTVRVGTIYCANVTLVAANGARFTLNDACNAGVGSGSFVSSDGYIATNGHVVYMSPISTAQGYFYKESADWNGYVRFLIQAGLASATEIQSAIDKYKAGDATALNPIMGLLAAVPKIEVSNEQNQFDIQTSDTPMKIDLASSRWKWVSQPGNLTDGKLIDFDVNKTATAYSETSTNSDVALIKVSGTFPNVTLSSLSSINTGDSVTAIGYPAVVDGGILTKKAKTVPTVTSGTVLQVGNDAGQHRMIAMSTRIAAGNSGGPAFDKSGNQIGLNTYGGSQCSGDSAGTNSCFGAGVARDGADLTALARKNNVNFSTNGEVTREWNRGVEAYLRGNFSAARTSFEKVDKAYPNNYLVAAFLESAKTQKDVAQPQSTTDNEDTSVPSDQDPSPYSASDEAYQPSTNAAAFVVFAIAAGLGILVLCVIIILAIVLVSRSQSRRSPSYQVPYAQQPPQYVQARAPQQYPSQPHYPVQPPAAAQPPYQAAPQPPQVYPQPQQPVQPSTPPLPPQQPFTPDQRSDGQ